MSATVAEQLQTGTVPAGTPNLSNTVREFPPIAAGPGGDPAPSGSGRAHHHWTDWVSVSDQTDLDEVLSERCCVECGADQIVPADSLLSVAVLRPVAVRVDREVA